ncbi:hypothetical protein GCM10007301_09140 [Azorhizobium oxalatiphilum]|uniref:Globin n=1 Tax=Azorhizobium oxalatiphilum TaxID=980631 RepID=A0A917BPP3_9HYPH|nr:group II truncated hemoglobin [Azorhizobium oxalatiphilum]GGF51875.1 hypothetical protein GCM10007301_09140 [Azorhizobium oxalatiphilum]
MSQENAATAGTEVSVYERIGGAATIDRLVEDFYHRMDTLPDAAYLRSLHRPDLTETKDVLKRYLSEWLGGPKLYTPERGHPRMRQRHMHVPIKAADRDAWLMCMRGALEDAVPDERTRQGIDAAMSRLADWMRNVAEPGIAPPGAP